MTSNTSFSVPVVFDLKENKVIQVDINTSIVGLESNVVEVNNGVSNRASFGNILESFTSLDNKISLYSLFELHALARGNIVETKEESDIVFGWEGDVTPYDISVINSEYL